MENMSSNIFFTADTHFDHTRIIELSHRPFSSRDEMNETMIANWNSMVAPGDTVYHLGDFAFAKQARIAQLLGMLNGHKHLVEGNHDDDQARKARGWASVRPYYRVRKALATSIVLFHFPIEIWDRRHKGSIHLFGHIHEVPLETQTELRHNVGMDFNEFKPVPLETIKQMAESRAGISMGEDWSEAFQTCSIFDESIPHFYRKQKVHYGEEDRPREVQAEAGPKD